MGVMNEDLGAAGRAQSTVRARRDWFGARRPDALQLGGPVGRDGGSRPAPVDLLG
jgi:hypothetical protein